MHDPAADLSRSDPLFQNQVQTQVAQIRHRFLERLTDRCLDMEMLANSIDRTGVDIATVMAIRQHAHKIAGVAATLGFDRLGALAAETDACMARIDGQTDWTAARPLLESLLLEIESVLETHAPV